MPSARTRTAGILGGRPDGALRRSLTLRDLIVYGLLFIAPMAPVGIYGALDARSHGVVPLVYVVATVAMSFTAYSYARMIHTAPQAGSVYAYARVGLGDGAGFVTGWMMMLDYLLIPAVAYLFSGIAMAQLVPEVDQWIWTAIAVVITTALNLSGVRRAALVGFLVLAMEILVLLVFVAAALVVLVQDGPQRGWLSPLTGDRAFSLTALLSAVSVAVLSFLGFDAIANFAEEAAGGKGRTAPTVARALVWCLLLTGVLFVAQTYLAALLSEDSSRQLAEDPAKQGSAFYDATEAAVGGWLETTVAASKALGAAFAALAGQAAASRLLYAMARDRRLPHVLGSVSPRTGVPGRALLVSAVLTMCAAVWAARAPDGLDRLVSIVDIGALFAFGMLHLSVVGYYGLGRRAGSGSGPTAEDPRARGVWDWVVPLVGLAIVVAVIVTANREAHWVGLGWFVLALLALCVLRARDRREGRTNGTGRENRSGGGG
ncbi:APC family permease [Streptomyces tubbatahanensis]|uniref:APC family permease n=1 Tax=Streptomyces tubbatahanensis TaxID=2923272 RepID=A0ABY3XW54_9ACTN|nr:APC family permease [Streptomyces tubbatahanensis]UNS98729.1 APC family permease [Streptomyces tubbatahanensis]